MGASSSARVAGVFLADGMGYIVFIDNKADNLFPRCLSRSTQMRYDPLSIRPPKLPIIDFIINIGRAADPPSPSQEKHTFRDKLQDP